MFGSSVGFLYTFFCCNQVHSTHMIHHVDVQKKKHTFVQARGTGPFYNPHMIPMLYAACSGPYHPKGVPALML